MTDAPTPSDLIDQRIASLPDWRGETLARCRALILEADPEVVEDWKWRGVPVWYRDGMICTGETYKAVVKLTFAKGAALPDPTGLFNSSLEGNARRAIDFHEGESYVVYARWRWGLTMKLSNALIRSSTYKTSRTCLPSP